MPTPPAPTEPTIDAYSTPTDDDSTPATGAGCAAQSISSVNDCQQKCSYYGFGSPSQSVTNSVVTKCSCSGANDDWSGEFSCSNTAGTVLPLSPQDGTPCTDLTFRDMETDFCDQLNRVCSNDLGQADVNIKGGTYRCRTCTTAKVVIAITPEEMEAAADASNVKISGPIFVIYLGLALVFRIGSILVGKFSPTTEKTGQKQEEEKNIDPDEPKVKVGAVQKIGLLF